jgi:hypothetical protein
LFEKKTSNTTIPLKHRINPKCHTVYPWGMSFTRTLIKVNMTVADSINIGPIMGDSIIRDPILINCFLGDITSIVDLLKYLSLDKKIKSIYVSIFRLITKLE